MAKEKEMKTNAMRILDKEKIIYTLYTYPCDAFTDGMQTAAQIGKPPEIMFKTLVTVGKSKNYYVFVIPLTEELDLKKAAKAVGEKSVEMIHVKDLQAITGYIRGGCTAIGMKKQYKTVVAAQAEQLEKMIVSGGKIGVQLELKPADYQKAAKSTYGDITL